MAEHVKYNASRTWESRIGITWSQVEGAQMSNFYKHNFKM